MYKWDVDDIRKKKAYILKRLKNVSNPLEEKKLCATLLSYHSILRNSSTIRYTWFPGILDKITKNISLQMEAKKYYPRIDNIFSSITPKLTDEYLTFLIKICRNLAEFPVEVRPLTPVSINDEVIIDVSRRFYESLEYDPFIKLSQKITNPDKKFINLESKSPHVSEQRKSIGLNIKDYLFNESYCMVRRENDLYDLVALNHEVMHGIDFQLRPRMVGEEHYGFHEIPTYAIDLVLLDYLDENGIYAEYTDEVRTNKKETTRNLAFKTFYRLQQRIEQTKNKRIFLGSDFDCTIADIREILDFSDIKDLLEIESYLIAEMIADRFKINKEMGMQTLKTLLLTPMPSDKTPSFEHIGIYPEEIIKVSETYYSSSKQSQIKI
ncbi:MAG: hypothetical protein PHN72_00810 [Bacilli bacterium]|nr:hypothetical protein [Bacilli bacterium]